MTAARSAGKNARTNRSLATNVTVTGRLHRQPETAKLAGFTKTAMAVLRSVSGAQGFNIGMNMGGVAGAGIAAHLHQHVVPRWGGDSNFMPVIGQTKVLPQLLADTRDMLAKSWPA